MTELLSPADYRLTETSVLVDAAMAQDRWEEVLVLLGSERSRSWHVGDLLAFGERKFGDGTYQRVADKLGYDYGTLRGLASVSRRVPPARRRADLSHRHHKAVAALPPTEQVEWLDRAAADGWTSDELTSAIVGDQLATDANADLDPTEHWDAAGMPDYDPEPQPFKLTVSPETLAERDAFLEQIGSPTVCGREAQSASMWWPDRPRDDVASVAFGEVA